MKHARKKARLTLRDLPADYAALCRFHLPRPIHDQADYENTAGIADAMAGFEEMMNADQNDYFDLLCRILEAWDREIAARWSSAHTSAFATPGTFPIWR